MRKKFCIWRSILRECTRNGRKEEEENMVEMEKEKVMEEEMEEERSKSW